MGPPDITTQTAGGTLHGIEVTAATPRNYANAVAARNRFRPDAPIEPDLFIVEQSRDKIIEILDESKTELHWMLSIGDAMEHEWANHVYASVKRKVECLNSEGFERFHTNWLIIHDSVPTIRLDYSKSMQILIHSLGQHPQHSGIVSFDAIFIESCGSFISLTDGKWVSVPINNLWKSNNRDQDEPYD